MLHTTSDGRCSTTRTHELEVELVDRGLQGLSGHSQATAERPAERQRPLRDDADQAGKAQRATTQEFDTRMWMAWWMEALAA